MKKLAYGLGLASVAVVGGTVWFGATGRGLCRPHWTPPGSQAAIDCEAMRRANEIGGTWEGITIGLLGLGFVLMGSFLVIKTKGNRFGLVFCVSGLAFLLTGFGNAYTIHGLVESSLPAAPFVAVLAEIVGSPIVFVPFAFFFLLYPTGSLPSRRWSPVMWAAVLSGATLLVTSVLGTDTLRLAPSYVHPLRVPAVIALRGSVEVVALLIYLVALLASIGSLIARFRRARGIERQQIRWFAASAAFIAVVFMCGPIFWATPSLEPLWGPLFVTALASLPIAATIAILKYRLYDIDLIINKALVYVLLTGVLASLYLGFVFALQSLLPIRTDSDLAVAASTLAAAALFRPLRARIQGFIDRRFYRRKYDASTALERLSRRLRDEVDLESVEKDVLTVVGSTVQPTHASLWLREVT